jgi:hypothetical protein
MVLNPSNFISEIVLFLRDYIRTNVSDPITRSEGFVMTAYPKREVQYPIITIKNTNIKTKKLGMSSEISSADVSIEVRVWARNSKECDELTQSVITTLKNAQYGTGSTSEYDIHGFELSSSNSVVETEGDNTVHSKVLNFKYSCVLT